MPEFLAHRYDFYLTARKIAFIPLLIALILIVEFALGLSLIPLSYKSILFLLILACLIFIALRPALAYLLLIIATPLYFRGIPTGLGYGRLYPFHLFVALVVIGWLIWLALHPKRRAFDLSPLHIPLLLFLIWGLFTTIWSPKFDWGLFSWSKLFFYWLLTLLSIWIIRDQTENDERYLNKVIYAWIVSGVVISLLGILTAPLFYKITHIPKFFAIPAELTAEKRAVSLSWHPNVLASHLNICILLAVFQLSDRGKFLKKLSLQVAICVMFVGLILSLSRSALVTLGGGLIIYFYLRGELTKRLLTMVSVALFVVMLLSLLQLLKGGWLVYGRYATILSFAQEEAMQIRVFHWKFGWDLFRESYGLGIGIGGYGQILHETVPKFTKNLHPHNIYLSILYEFGIAGMILFFWFMGGLLSRLINSITKCQNIYYQRLMCVLFAIIISYGLHGLLDFTLLDRKIWPFLGLVMGVLALAEAREKKDEVSPA